MRAGRDGKPFRIFKFRSIVVNADKIGGPSTSDDDPPMTRVGRFLRKYKLDELPQLISVLKRDMSLGSISTMEQHNISQLGDLEERKLKEIEHFRKRRSILQGFERHSDTNPDNEVSNLDSLVRDSEAFEKHFSNMKFYSVTRTSEQYYFGWLRERCPGHKALDYCCGSGENAIFMAKSGADAVGIDISPEGIDNCRLNAIHEGVEQQARFYVMDGEAMEFADNTFDVIVEYAALHHLDYSKAMSELQRVIKPAGEIICIEALRHNPLIQLYRKVTPHLRTEWEVEHILGVNHLAWSKKYFGEVKAKFFHLAVLGAVPFRKTWIFKPMLKVLEAIDNAILKTPIRRFAWIMVFTLSKPKKEKQWGK